MNPNRDKYDRVTVGQIRERLLFLLNDQMAGASTLVLRDFDVDRAIKQLDDAVRRTIVRLQNLDADASTVSIFTDANKPRKDSNAGSAKG